MVTVASPPDRLQGGNHGQIHLHRFLDTGVVKAFGHAGSIRLVFQRFPDLKRSESVGISRCKTISSW